MCGNYECSYSCSAQWIRRFPVKEVIAGSSPALSASPKWFTTTCVLELSWLNVFWKITSYSYGYFYGSIPMGIPTASCLGKVFSSKDKLIPSVILCSYSCWFFPKMVYHKGVVLWLFSFSWLGDD